MDSTTPTTMTMLRQALERRVSDLRAELQAAAQVARDAGAAPAHEVLDRKEEAQRRQSDELSDAEQQRDRDELAQVEAALRRMDAGTYGECTDCGEAIAPARLQLQPAAARCAACQQAHESRPGARLGG